MTEVLLINKLYTESYHQVSYMIFYMEVNQVQIEEIPNVNQTYTIFKLLFTKSLIRVSNLYRFQSITGFILLLIYYNKYLCSCVWIIDYCL